MSQKGSPKGSESSSFGRSRPRADDELERDEFAFFKLPRKSCKEIAPELLRLQTLKKKAIQQHRLRTLKRMLQRAQIDGAVEHMQRIIEFDKSDSIVPHGEVSKRMYNQICQRRPFDLYGQRIYTKMTRQEEHELKLKAKALGVEYEGKEPDYEQLNVKVPNIFEDITADIRLPVITTDKYKIGFVENYNPPGVSILTLTLHTIILFSSQNAKMFYAVGFASNPAQQYKSYGHEVYFAYDGLWERGKMHGPGLYQYADGGNFEGYYENNRQHGRGVAKYKTIDAEYNGPWEHGWFCGEKAKQRFRDSSSYEGEFRNGRRQGVGKLKFASGLLYEGEFLNGVPHGRGVMKSKLTGYSYEGSFELGSIEGSGVLILPPPECTRVVQYFPHTKRPKTLPEIVR